MDLKANKVNTTSSSITPTTFTAQEWNQIIKEKNNILKRANITPSSSDTTQLTRAIKEIANDPVDWVKPEDWIDIRSGALPNSIYLLVGHSIDKTSKYKKLSFKVNLVDGGNYDVFVDGIKVATTGRGFTTTLDWSTLDVEDGFRTIHPEILMTHIVRITPSDSTNTINQFGIEAITGQKNQGVLWAHFTTDDYIALGAAFGNTSSTVENLALECITCSNESLKVSSINMAFYNCTSLQSISTLLFETSSRFDNSFFECSALRHLKLNNATPDMVNRELRPFMNCSALKKIEVQNGSIPFGQRTFEGCTSLKSLPQFAFADSYQADNSNAYDVFKGCENLEDAVVDATPGVAIERLTIGGTAEAPLDGIKGVLVSSEAPFSSTTSPQLDVSHTGMDTPALAGLFNSMPYNVGYTVVGSPTISDGVASGFSTTDYVKMPIYTSGTDIFIKTAFVRTEADTNVRIITNNISAEKMIALNYASGYLKGSVTINNTRYQVDSSVTIVAGTKYYTEVERVGTKLKIRVSTDKNTWVTDEIDVPEGALDIKGSEVRIGANPGIATVFWKGSIDLNETYIKVDGVTFFNGAATRQLDTAATNVGGVTITNGVASGTFSSSKHIKTNPFYMSGTNTFEMQLRFKPLSSRIEYRTLFGNDYGLNIKTTGGVPYIRVSVYDGTTTGSVDITYNDLNTFYLLKIVYENGVSTVYLNGELKETLTKTIDTRNLIYGIGAVYTGNNFSAAAGSNVEFDLNNTYIMVNGTKVFSGMVPMTKTCSVVGCRGNQYTIVGSPTINDGKVSDFSGSDYLSIIKPFKLNADTVADFVFKVNATDITASSGVKGICGTPGSYGLHWGIVNSNSKLGIWLGNGSSWTMLNSKYGTTSLQTNTDYYVKLSFNKKNVSMYLSTDGKTWNTEFSQDITISTEYTYNLAVGRVRQNTQYFKGTIDLNESYITYNDKSWFGPRAGNLTQDDKDIVLNKGWSLTVQ